MTAILKSQAVHPDDSEAGRRRRPRMGLVRLAIDLTAASGGDVLLRGPEVAAIIGVSVPTLYRMITASNFPGAIAPTPGTRAWPMSVVQGWIRERIADGGSDAR